MASDSEVWPPDSAHAPMLLPGTHSLRTTHVCAGAEGGLTRSLSVQALSAGTTVRRGPEASARRPPMTAPVLGSAPAGSWVGARQCPVLGSVPTPRPRTHASAHRRQAALAHGGVRRGMVGGSRKWPEGARHAQYTTKAAPRAARMIPNRIATRDAKGLRRSLEIWPLRKLRLPKHPRLRPAVATSILTK